MKIKDQGQFDAALKKLKENIEQGLTKPEKFIAKSFTVRDLLDDMKDDLKKLIEMGYSVADLYKMLNVGMEGSDNEIVSRSSLVKYLNDNKLRKRRRKQKHQKEPPNDSKLTDSGHDSDEIAPTGGNVTKNASKSDRSPDSESPQGQPTDQDGASAGTTSTQQPPNGTYPQPEKTPAASNFLERLSSRTHNNPTI